ncbi:MAG TPA: polysaccharide lyase family 7 protein [bacterium]|nr:polysaccharide lyase family 7 protein [bacterium]
MKKSFLLSAALLITISLPGFALAAIDFTNWELQEPSGSGTSPTIITGAQMNSGYSDAYFYVAGDGGQIFMDTATGITTSGSVHPRCEMREMSGGVGAAWAPTGTNTETVSGQVIQLGDGSSGHTTIAQVFNSTLDIPLCEFQYEGSVGGFEILYEEAKGAGTMVNLNTACALNTPYNFSLSLSGNVLTVTINGVQVYTHTPSAGVLADQFYFKCGNYDQTAVAGAVSTTPYTVVEDDSIVVFHGSGTPTPTVPNTATNTATLTFTNTSVNTATLTNTFTSTITNTPTNTAAHTNTFTETFTNTATHTAALTQTFTQTSTSTFTNTATNTFTVVITNTPTITTTATLTNTGTLVPTNTFTSTPTFTYTSSATNTATSTFTNTATNTFSGTPNVTSTSTFTNTLTAAATGTYTNSATSTNSFTATSTVTSTATSSFTPTATVTNTFTSTNTLVFTNTPTFTNSATPINTSTHTCTPTSTCTLTPTPANCPGVPAWSGGNVAYGVGQTAGYNGELYQCVAAHTSEPGWQPPVVPALWKNLGPCGTTPTNTSGQGNPVIYPNPVTSSTVTLQLPMANATNVKVRIFTIAFREVQTLNAAQVAGNSLIVNLVDKSVTPLANGLYYFVIQAEGQRWTNKVLILR